jgi:hypothetical protein
MINTTRKTTTLVLAAATLGAVGLSTPALADRERGFSAPGGAVADELNRVAERYGYGDVVHIEHRKKHVKGFTRDEAGNPVEIKLDRYGNVDEIEVEYGWNRRGWTGHASEDEIRSNIERAGYSMLHLADRKKNHYEILAENGEGDVVELHVDFGGNVYKSKLKPMEFGMAFEGRGRLIEERRSEGPRGERR